MRIAECQPGRRRSANARMSTSRRAIRTAASRRNEAEERAARTVNKERRETGETKNKRE
jgi:hypothetical protein